MYLSLLKRFFYTLCFCLLENKFKNPTRVTVKTEDKDKMRMTEGSLGEIGDSCDVDSNCSELLFCYNTDLLEGCNCNFLLGWTGDDCTEDGPGVTLLKTLGFIEIFIGLLLFIRILLLYKYLKHPLVDYLDSNCRILYVLTMAMISFFAWRSITLATVYNPQGLSEDNIGKNLKGKEERYHDLFPIETIAIGVLMTFITVIMSNIGILWLETAQRIQQNTITYEKKKKMRDTLRYILHASQVVWVITYFVLLLNEELYATVSALSYLLIHGILLVVAFFKIRSLLKFSLEKVQNRNTHRAFKDSIKSKKLTTEPQKLEKYIKVIQRTAFGLLLSFFFFVAGTGPFLFLSFSDNGWKDFATEDNISPNLIAIEVVSFSTLLFAFVTEYFCRESFRQLDMVRLRAKSDVLPTSQDIGSTNQSTKKPGTFIEQEIESDGSDDDELEHKPDESDAVYETANVNLEQSNEFTVLQSNQAVIESQL